MISECCFSWLSSANPWCITDRPLHHAGPTHLHPHCGRDQGDHRGLCEYHSITCYMGRSYYLFTFKASERGTSYGYHYLCPYRKDTKQTTQWTRRRQQVWSACVLVNMHHLSVIFPWVCLCLFVWVLFSFHGWVNSCCLSLTIVWTPDKSLVAMNTVWALLYRLTDGCVVLVSQCCETEPGRRSSGNRYRYHHRSHLCCCVAHHHSRHSLCFARPYNTVWCTLWHVWWKIIYKAIEKRKLKRYRDVFEEKIVSKLANNKVKYRIQHNYMSNVFCIVLEESHFFFSVPPVVLWFHSFSSLCFQDFLVFCRLSSLSLCLVRICLLWLPDSKTILFQLVSMF